MAEIHFEEKGSFIAFIEDIIGKRKTGLVSIATETGRSILLKFSLGVLIHSYSRNIDIRDFLKVVNESGHIKFDIAPIPVEEGTEILSGTQLLHLLQPEYSLEKQANTSQAGGRSVSLKLQSTRELLENIAAEYVGVAAEILVEESMDVSGSLDETIDKIASVIPNPEQSAAFRSSARQQIRQIGV
jgi:hypothetical protein